MTQVLLLCGSGLYCLPGRQPGARLAALGGHHSAAARHVGPRARRGFVVCALIVAAIAGLVFEPVSTLAAALVVGPGWRRWHERRRAALRVSEAEAMAEALRTMVAELRAGAPPVAATEAAAVEAPPKAAKALRAAVASAGLGVATGAGALAQLTTAWTLAAQHGLPMADVLDAIRRDLDAAARFANRTRAGMAGPRASASILVLLPFVGIALGEAMGANPLRILVTTSPGNVLLLAGSGLICAGMAWSARLTGQVTPW